MGTTASWEFQSIPIDFEVFKALTAQLESPSDTYNDVLRRRLGLEIRPIAAQTEDGRDRPWIIDGVVFPHGSEFRGRYGGLTHSGRVDDGALVVNGKRFDSPSPAAISITGNSVNGWKFWECRRPGKAGWTGMDSFRKR